MAGVALAALAHGGLLAGAFLLAPASSSGLGLQENVFRVTLVEEPVLMSEPEPEPVPPPPPAAPEQLIATSAIIETPSPPSAETREAPAPPTAPVPVADAVPVEAEPVLSRQEVKSADEAGAAFVTIQPASEPGVSEASQVETSASFSGATVVSGDGKAMRDAYLRDVRLQLARHAPRGVRGAGNCEVEFRLSRAGEVVFVGIRSSSGSRLYDRRCLKSVTSAVPFPVAPDGATQADLSFTIVMQQKQ